MEGIAGMKLIQSARLAYPFASEIHADVCVEKTKRLVKARRFGYTFRQQHPPRLSTMRTMGGYFFPGRKSEVH